MLGIVIPAHNEELCLDAALSAARLAACHPALLAEPVHIAVALDACSDASEEIARRHHVVTLHLTARRVGEARARGADYLLQAGARWLAFTDADTVVAPDWLAQQLMQGADAVCGTVAVDRWEDHAEQVRARFQRDYTDCDGHRHIHGANFGISADAYRRVGGFRSLACDEDVAIVEALDAIGAHIAWSCKPRVITSARRLGKACGGFADTLLKWGVEESQGGRSPTDGMRLRGGSASASSYEVTPDALRNEGDHAELLRPALLPASPNVAG